MDAIVLLVGRIPGSQCEGLTISYLCDLRQALYR